MVDPRPKRTSGSHRGYWGASMLPEPPASPLGRRQTGWPRRFRSGASGHREWPGNLRAKRRDCLLFIVVHIENGIELCNLHQVMNTFGQTQEL